jgi:predicted nucleic acid-binding protein
VLFIDTGAIIAHHLKRDQHHRLAVLAWKRIVRTREQCVTTNFILNEVFTYFSRHVNYVFAAERARNIYASRQFVVFRPQEEDEIVALEFFEKFADQQVSFTDCVSFVFMRKNKIRRAFAFDHHFALAGFTMYP